MDRFQALRTFRRVVELNSFSAAARDLALSPAAVSKHVRELEAGLGAALLVRTTRRLSLTDAGQSYFRDVTRILDALDEADEGVSAAARQPAGLVRLTAPMSLGIFDLTRRLVRFRERYPDIRLDVALDDRPVDLVEQGFDLAIRGSGVMKDSTLRGRRLTAMSRCLIAAPAYLARHGRVDHPDDLQTADCLSYSLAAERDLWRLSRDGETVAVEITPVWRLSNSLALVEAVMAGQGLALVPRFLAAEALADGRLVECLPDWQPDTHTLHVLYPAHREHSARVRALADHLIESFAETPLG
jgi:DNA-binding transcriptional LysR family regulator